MPSKNTTDAPPSGVVAAAAAVWGTDEYEVHQGRSRKERRRRGYLLTRDLDAGISVGFGVGLLAGCLIGYLSFYDLGYNAGVKAERERHFGAGVSLAGDHVGAS